MSVPAVGRCGDGTSSAHSSDEDVQGRDLLHAVAAIALPHRRLMLVQEADAVALLLDRLGLMQPVAAVLAVLMTTMPLMM